MGTKKTRKAPKAVSWEDIITYHKEGRSAKEISGNLGCSTSVVYRAIRQSKGGEKQRKKPKQSTAALSISIRLPEIGGAAEIKVRNGGNELVGTLLIESEGICYRRPNQKSAAERGLSWDSLDKLMQLGIG